MLEFFVIHGYPGQCPFDQLLDTSQKFFAWVIYFFGIGCGMSKRVLHGKSPKDVSLVVAFTESYSTEGRFTGLGVVFRDHTGSVIAALSKKPEGCFSVEVAELLVICKGLQFAARSGLHVDYVESDVLCIIQGLQSTFPLTTNAFIFNDVKSLLVFIKCGFCHFTPRSVNKVARLLADLVLHSPSDMGWVDFLPLSISSIVLNDLHF
ncbi:Ribonuclease H-like domain containing protein [Parasponia andersonii]|uniref:Ribonuclease H-like domain containing protein n=1 Tax=Parasponia andersonii TaxID=3476 RepID=A0A2P5BA96_PARAD|nr:Ribonuclease H-like domain containing protein [Parasponia andersonii]